MNYGRTNMNTIAQTMLRNFKELPETVVRVTL
jgi:hypothetical protein